MGCVVQYLSMRDATSRLQLLPVLTTMLRLSADEQQQLQRNAHLGDTANTDTDTGDIAGPGGIGGTTQQANATWFNAYFGNWTA